MNILDDPLIQVRLRSSEAAVLSLPDLYAALRNDEIVFFRALRPHQRHPWHAFLCQLGALACARAGLDDLPADAGTWSAILAALTPDWPDGEPWCLVSPPGKPALLQPVAGPLDGLKSRLTTPDELDMLVTAKNHDLKGARMVGADADDWLFALIALQTSEGFLGAGNYGVSRMNGGFANRPGVGLAPKGGIGAHVARDIRRMIAMREAIFEADDFYGPDGPALLWLPAWDGTTSLPRKGLDPYYIEICRRVRLVEEGGRIAARAGNSKVPRLVPDKEGGGITGDPWTPVDRRNAEGLKALTVDSRGFDYRRLSDILFGEGYDPAALQSPVSVETGDGWTLVCRALARGQGKTEGYHERRIRVPGKLLPRIRTSEGRSKIGLLSKDRIREAAAVRGALRFALMTLFQNGPDEFKPQDPSSGRRAERFLDDFQDLVDDDFFARLFAEETGEETRKAWLLSLLDRAKTTLRAAESVTPSSAVRRHCAFVRADAALYRRFKNAEELASYFKSIKDALPEDEEADADVDAL